MEPEHPTAMKSTTERRDTMNTNGVVLAKSLLAVCVEWREDAGVGFVRPKNYPRNVYVKRAELHRNGFDTMTFGDFVVCDVANFEGNPVAVNVRAATSEDLEQ